MKFVKPARSLDEQADLLRSRGMVGDPAEMKRRLDVVNYYRLSAYWHTFRGADHRFLPGTTIQKIWARYTFDRELRLLVMDALERFEVAVRARLAYHHALANGPFDYATDVRVLFAKRPEKRTEFLRRLLKDVANNRHETFIEHFQRRYGDSHAHPPIWVAVEVLTFGGVVSLYRGSDRAIQRSVARSFGLADPVFESWLLLLNAARNICAHHGRLWNREFGLKPKLPRQSVWHMPVPVGRDRVFGLLTILAYLVQEIAAGSTWAVRLRSLVVENPEIPLSQMGFPTDWTENVVWKRALNEL